MRIYEREQLTGALDWASRQYEEILPTNPRLCAYLKERGFSQESIAKWHIGYAPNQWQFLTHQARSETGEYTFDCLQEAGLVTEKEGRQYDRFVHRITFPIHDTQGRIISFTARQHPDDTNKDIAKYVNGPETAIYSKQNTLFGLVQAIRTGREQGLLNVNEVLITEGAPDVILAHQHNLPYTVAPCGTAYTSQQVQLIKRWFPNATQVLCFDGDTAGNEATARKVIDLFGSNVEVALLPAGKDLADVCTHYANPQSVINGNRKSDLAFLWEYFSAEKNMESEAQRMTVLQKVAPIIRKAPQETIPLYCGMLAERAGVSASSLEKLVGGNVSGGTIYTQGSIVTTTGIPPVREPAYEIKLHPFALEKLETLFTHHLLATTHEKQTVAYFEQLFEHVPISYELKGLLQVLREGQLTLSFLGTELGGRTSLQDLEIAVQDTFPQEKECNGEYLARLVGVHINTGIKDKHTGRHEALKELEKRAAILLAHVTSKTLWEKYENGEVTLEELVAHAQTKEVNNEEKTGAS